MKVPYTVVCYPYKIHENHYGTCYVSVTLILYSLLVILQQITPDNLHPDIGLFISDDVDKAARLALVILAEQKMGQVSFINLLSGDGLLSYVSRWLTFHFALLGLHFCKVVRLFCVYCL